MSGIAPHGSAPFAQMTVLFPDRVLERLPAVHEFLTRCGLAGIP